MADSLSNRILGAISSSPLGSSLLGKASKAIDVIGKATGGTYGGLYKMPEMGLSERGESLGSKALTPQEQAKKVEERSAQLKISPVYTQQTQPYSSTPQTTTTSSGGEVPISDLVAEYKRRGWTDEAAIMGDIAAGGGKGYLGGGGGGEPVTPTRDVIGGTPGSQYLGESDIGDLIKKYGEQVTGSTDTLARDIEARATAAADREYQSILSLLGGQKGEVSTLSTQQKEAAGKQKKLTQEELTAREGKEVSTIGKEKEAFGEEVTQTVETLARNWRDLSLEIQRIARARGISDSAFAAGKETDLLLNFNTGLRAIASKSTAALKDFSDAVVETVSFYQRQGKQLDLDTNNQMQEIDNWERQQVTNIQGQETMAYNKKLTAIEEAMTKADTLRVNTANAITEKKLAWGLWLVQMDYSYKQAVAIAAQQSVGSAATKVNDVRNLFKMMADVLDNGGEIIPQKDDKGNIIGGTVHGILPSTGEDVYLPITAGGTTNLLLQQAGNIYGTMNKNNEVSNMISGNPALSNIYSQLTGNQQATVQAAQPGTMQGVLDAIKAVFK